MTKIFISYSFDGMELAEKLKQALAEREYVVLDPRDSISPGDEISKRIESLIKSSDVVIQIFGERSLNEVWFDRERSLASAMGKFTIPLVIGGSEPPKEFDDHYVLRADLHELPDMIRLIDKSITQNLVEREDETTEKKEVRQRVESNISQYIESSLSDLKGRESSLRKAAVFWYLMGYAALLFGVVFGVYNGYSVKSSSASFEGIFQLAIISLVLLGLLIGLSKYAFTLGKAYMVESLRNSDRIHAISFGDFFVKAFPDELEWEKIKEVFQHWNIDKGSEFSLQNGDSFDPKILQIAVEIAKALNKK